MGVVCEVTSGKSVRSGSSNSTNSGYNPSWRQLINQTVSRAYVW